MLRRPTSLGTYEESQGSNWPSVSCSMISKPTPQSGCSNDRYFCPNRSRTSETVTARFMRCSCHQESVPTGARSEEHTSELQSLMRISYAVFCLKKETHKSTITNNTRTNKHA